MFMKINISSDQKKPGLKPGKSLSCYQIFILFKRESNSSDKVFSLQVPHSNLSAEYKVNYKYIGVTYDETRAVAITNLQYRACQHANG